MNIVLFLNKDLEANIAYDLLKSELLNHNVRIYYSDTVGNPKDKPSSLVKLEYFEKGFFFNELSEFIKENNIGHTFEFFDDRFKSFPLKACANVNSGEFIKEIRSFNPELFISIRFGKIFKEEIIRIPKYGLLNLHSAILPFYRGIMGTLHAIKEGNRNIGCTLHTIPDAGIDTGEIIEIAELDVNRERSLFWNIVQLYPLGAELIIKTLKVIDTRSLLRSQKQNPLEGNYFSVPTKEDFEQVEMLGMKIISAADYLNVLTNFVVKDLSESERERLKICMERTRLMGDFKSLILETELSKAQFRARYFQGATPGSGWTRAYWDHFFESESGARYFVIEPDDPQADRMFIRSGANKHCIFFLSEAAEESMYGSR